MTPFFWAEPITADLQNLGGQLILKEIDGVEIGNSGFTLSFPEASSKNAIILRIPLSPQEKRADVKHQANCTVIGILQTSASLPEFHLTLLLVQGKEEHHDVSSRSVCRTAYCLPSA